MSSHDGITVVAQASTATGAVTGGAVALGWLEMINENAQLIGLALSATSILIAVIFFTIGHFRAARAEERLTEKEQVVTQLLEELIEIKRKVHDDEDSA